MCLPPGGEVDRSGTDLFAIHRLVHGALSNPREMLGKDGREGRRHMLGDQDRRTLNDATDLRDQEIERLRSAGGRTDQQHARGYGWHRPQGYRGRSGDLLDPLRHN
jgi:hypothetical protein